VAVSELPEVIELGLQEEAVRLWRGAQEAFKKADENLVALCEALDFGLRAAEDLGIHLLQPVRKRFTSSIGLQLELPMAEVEIFRDAIGAAHSLGFTELLDLLSEESLDCVAPGLHRGWENSTYACRRCRETAQQAIGLTLDAGPRRSLLLLSAYRNRIFHYSPPIRIVPGEIVQAYGDLIRLMDHLLKR